ncbi:MAG: GPW/gp25 family protein [Gammaproteobacteria bacterium]|nr:GPW/gp25 family protein [Gammaproteobacteria bacterium]
MTEFGFPFRIDSAGRTADAAEDAHVRQLVEQLLFTEPGERVNRPDFGGGLRRLLFAANSPEVASATEYLVQGALQRFLGDRIQIEAVKVKNIQEKLEVTVQYRLLRTQERRVERFSQAI